MNIILPRATLLFAKLGFSCAGEGVFVEDRVKSGSIVALYPGVVYRPDDMILVYPHIYLDNPYLISRPDQVCSYINIFFLLSSRQKQSLFVSC